MDKGREKQRTRFVSFSGIDGAGKSTQIQALYAHCETMGLRVRLIAFWDDVARLTRIREGAGHRVFKGDKGVGTPAAPINRRDKNVRSPLMTAVRLFLYFVDAISLRLTVESALRSDADLVIFDRYIYDELANLALHNPAIRAYVWLILKLAPRPDIGFLLDADPVEARARKPEYPLDFLYGNRNAYLALCNLAGLTVIAPMPAREVELEILKHTRKGLSFGTAQSESGEGKDFAVNRGSSATVVSESQLPHTTALRWHFHRENAAWNDVDKGA
jgi:thymidylate kinase